MRRDELRMVIIMKRKNILFALLALTLASCNDSLNCCCKFSTNTYSDYDSFVSDFTKQNGKNSNAFYLFDVSNVFGSEFVSNPLYKLSGVDECVPCTEECKKDNDHILTWDYTAYYCDTLTIDQGKEWDSPYVSNELAITINFECSSGDAPTSPAKKVPTTIEWTGENSGSSVYRHYYLGDYLNAEFKYLTIGKINPTEDERYLVNKIDGIVDDMKDKIKATLLSKFGEESN